MSPVGKWRPILTLCLGLGALAIWLQVPDPSSPQSQISQPDDVPQPAPLAKIIPSASSGRYNSEDGGAQQGEAAERDVIAAFEKLNRYQRGTVQVSPNDYDLVNPGARYERPHSLSRNPNDPESDWTVLLTADRYYITEDQTSLIRLSLKRQGDPQPVIVESAVISMFDANGLVMSTPAPVFNAGTEAIIRLKPSDYWPAESGPLKVDLTYSSYNLSTKRGRLDFHYTGPERIPAEFVDVVADRVVDGDLIFDLAVHVYLPGDYRMSALIHDREGTVFGRAQADSWLEPGSQLISMSFDGLLFHDTDARSPFHLSTLRGERLNPLSLNGNDQMPIITGQYKTLAYDHASFRDEVVVSSHRERMRQHYENAIARGVTFLPVDD